MNEQPEHKSFKIETDPEPPSFAKLAKLAAEIQALGYDEKTATHYAVLIGENPILNPDGTVVVMEEGKLVANLKLKSFTGEKLV